MREETCIKIRKNHIIIKDRYGTEFIRPNGPLVDEVEKLIDVYPNAKISYKCTVCRKSWKVARSFIKEKKLSLVCPSCESSLYDVGKQLDMKLGRRIGNRIVTALWRNVHRSIGKCNGDFSQTKRVLESLGLTEDEINACIEDVLCAGGPCDCEMIFNLLSDYVGRARAPNMKRCAPDAVKNVMFHSNPILKDQFIAGNAGL